MFSNILGGDFVEDRSYPGFSLYHEGMDLVAVVSTGDDVWKLQVTGQLVNDTWQNIGIVWEPYYVTPEGKDEGGLQVIFIFIFSIILGRCQKIHSLEFCVPCLCGLLECQ